MTILQPAPALGLLDQPDSRDVVPHGLHPAELPQNAGAVDPAVRVVEPVVVGHEPQPPLLRRLAARAALGIVLGGLGLGAIVIGAILTMTIVAAPVGIPMIILGLILCAVALLAPFSRGLVRLHVARWPRPRP